MARKVKIIDCFYWILISTTLCINSVKAEVLHVAVASNFKSTFETILPVIQAFPVLSKLKIISSSGSSGVLYAQIIQGAPYDIFLSADLERPDKLIERKLALASSKLIYARGQVALWQLNSQTPVGLELLRNNDKRYTLANPKYAPYGQAGKVLMQNNKLWLTQDVRRITAHNIASAFQYIASGTIELGWVAFSQLKQWQKKHPLTQQHYWLPQLDDYPAINQAAVMLSRTRNKDLSSLFLEKLSAPEVKSLIKSQGYIVPEQEVGHSEGRPVAEGLTFRSVAI